MSLNLVNWFKNLRGKKQKTIEDFSEDEWVQYAKNKLRNNDIEAVRSVMKKYDFSYDSRHDILQIACMLPNNQAIDILVDEFNIDLVWSLNDAIVWLIRFQSINSLRVLLKNKKVKKALPKITKKNLIDLEDLLTAEKRVKNMLKNLEMDDEKKEKQCH